MTTVRDIIRAHLEQHGYDGLVSDDGECGCHIDDLAPCRGNIEDCRSGYRHLSREYEGEFIIAVDRCAGENCTVPNCALNPNEADHE